MFSCFRASAIVPSASSSAVVPAKPPAEPTRRPQAGPVGDSDAAQALIEKIRSSVIGSDVVVQGPFGPRRISYADFTASGRSLSFIEDYIRAAVLPFYANTHTESSGTGRQTSLFREEARSIIREAVGAGDEHAVIFCGSGSTAAINRVISVLGLQAPSELAGQRVPLLESERPVVFVGPYEHHSNEIPWRESLATVVTIEADRSGNIDLVALEAALIAHRSRPLRIGSFSAASNVTGLLSDTAAISALLHRHGALSFWDYAAAAPYVDINMGSAPSPPPPSATPGDVVVVQSEEPDKEAASPPGRDPLSYYDAVFISPHKFVGGPGTPGLLVARRALFHNRVPSVPGGGTVAYVNVKEHDFIADVEAREEGGTPAIVESIRCGLVFQLKGAVGVPAIHVRKASFIRRAIAAWAAIPNLFILGSTTAPRLSIISFVIRHGAKSFLHHNFVVALLNDLFGIQSRGGCSCAGPYGHRLLEIDLETSHRFEDEIVRRGQEGVKPGWVRVSFNFFISETQFAFILEAVRIIAEQGYRLLPQYEFSPGTGLWRHRQWRATAAGGAGLLSLRSIDYAGGAMAYSAPTRTEPEARLADYLADARRILAEASSLFGSSSAAPATGPPPADGGAAAAASGAQEEGVPPLPSPGFEALRWFPLPAETAAGGGPHGGPGGPGADASGRGSAGSWGGGASVAPPPPAAKAEGAVSLAEAIAVVARHHGGGSSSSATAHA